MTTVFVRDLLERAVKSFLQGALAVVVLQLGASGLGTNPLDLGAWQSLGVAALGGGLTALGSLITSVLSGLKTGTASAVPVVAQTAVDSDKTATLESGGVTVTYTAAKHDGDEPNATTVGEIADKNRYGTP